MCFSFCNEVVTLTAHSSGPLILTCIREASMSLFRVLLNRDFNRLTADAPLSGHALETGSERQISAISRRRGKRADKSAVLITNVGVAI